MANKLFKTLGLLGFCTMIAAFAPVESLADEVPAEEISAEEVLAEEEAEYEAGTEMLVRVDDMDTDLYAEPDEDAEVVGQAETGNTYTILELVDDEWMKISTGESEGYLNTVKTAAAVEKPEELAEEAVIDESSNFRKEIAEYGLQFVGGRYVYGGTDPNKGADCSGFTSYVLRNAAGVELPHSAAGQSQSGRVISAEEMRPGDLICYSSGKRINHVALYIGDGQVVHASTEKTGIKVSRWDYRKPAKIVNVLGD